jgi:hypothetical protein
MKTLAILGAALAISLTLADTAFVGSRATALTSARRSYAASTGEMGKRKETARLGIRDDGRPRRGEGKAIVKGPKRRARSLELSVRA